MCRGGRALKKQDLIKKSIHDNMDFKTKILKNVLDKIKDEEKDFDKDINVLILYLIQRKDMYGYEIVKEIELKSKGTFSLKEAMLYPVLHSLEGDGMLVSYWEDDSNINKKYYRLSDKGKKYLEGKEKQAQNLTMLKESIGWESAIWE
jgi:DNA-binding PadR family transcriptional regulator